MISIRPAHPEDADAIAALFSASRRLLDFLPELHSVAEDRAHIGDHVLVNLRVTVALRDGAIVGFMAERPGWIDHFYMDATLLRSGIGSALMLVAQAHSESLELWCFAENHRGRAFYEKHGFLAMELTDGLGNEAKAPDIRYRWTRT